MFEKKEDVSEKRKSEGGFMMLESMGSILMYLILIAGVAVVLATLFSSSKLGETEQAVVSMRMQIQHLFSGGSDYAGLDNDLAIKSGIVPKRLLRGTNLINPWGGSVTVAATADTGIFSITFAGIPQEECTKLATFQLESWNSITVNGNDIPKDTGAAAAAASCASTNTIAFTSR